MKINERVFLVQRASGEFILRNPDMFETTDSISVRISILASIITTLSDEQFFKENKIVFGRMDENSVPCDEFDHPSFKKKYFKILKIIDSFTEEFKLTYGEWVSILSDKIAFEAKYQIRLERHGNYDTPGGEE